MLWCVQGEPNDYRALYCSTLHQTLNHFLHLFLPGPFFFFYSLILSEHKVPIPRNANANADGNDLSKTTPVKHVSCITRRTILTTRKYLLTVHADTDKLVRYTYNMQGDTPIQYTYRYIYYRWISTEVVGAAIYSIARVKEVRNKSN